MKDLKLIIFDLDGTLIDAYQAIIKSFNFTMVKLKYPKQADTVIRRSVGWGDVNLIKPFVKNKDLSLAISIYRRRHKSDLVRYSRLLPGAKTAISYLKSSGYKLAVASNRPSRFSRILIKHLNIGKYFDYILCADKLKFAKPNPQILNEIRRKFNVLPDQALYVGDMAIDAIAGRRAGIKTVIVTTGSSLKSQIKKEKPYRIISAISRLIKHL